ncbi:MAG: flippase-like domain-containing protein [Bacteroidales bacterium]|nr:flippase-like domain-containing protein [Bacteroidales bacterium]
MSRKAVHSSRDGAGRPWIGAIVKFIVPVAVSCGLCWIMFHNIDFNAMLGVIREQCDFRWIGLMLGMSVIPMILRAVRWGIQLRALGVNAPLHSLIYSVVGCYSLNLVFPRLGEVWRTGYIAYREDAPFSTVFGSMIADRFADLLTVGLLTALTFFLAREPIVDFVRTYPDAYNAIMAVVTSPWVWLAVLGVVYVIWFWLSRSRGGFAGKVRGFMGGLWEGFAAVVHMKGKLVWLVLTVGIWGCYYVQLVVAFNAFPVLRELIHSSGLIVTLVCFVLTSISMGVPSSGGIGPYQTTMLFGLNIFLPLLQRAQEASGAVVTGPGEFAVTGAAFGNVVIAAQTMLQIVLGLVVFLLVALDKRRQNSSPERCNVKNSM